MTKLQNPVLGVIECSGCGGECTVHQTSKGQARYLYTRCPECKVDQRTGKAVQTRLWSQTSWRDGVEPNKPPNVNEEIERAAPIEAETEAETSEEEANSETPSKPAIVGPLALLGVLVVGALALAG